MVLKLSSARTMARRFLRGFGTLDAHRQPDVGALQGRCVVDTISGHGRDFTVCLQGFDQPQLVFRTGTGKDVDFPDDPSQFGIVHFFEFGTCDSRFADADVQTFADDTRRFDMVACDHLDDDACVMALVDRKERFLTGRGR